MLSAAACSSPEPAAHSSAGSGAAVGGSAAETDTPASTAGGRGGAAGTGMDTSNPTQLVVPTSMSMPGSEVTGACTGQIQSAREVQVDMYIMLDRSSSMQEKTGTGSSKWQAIGEALRDFVQDGQSQGLAVGLQYFPIGVPGVPETCSADSQCGSGGSCLHKACLPSAVDNNATITPCLSDNDCPLFSDGCVPFGTCSGDASLACFDIGPGGCQAQGDCMPYEGNCTNYASCNESDYAKPAVALAGLPGNAPALVASLTAVQPLGNTPTPPALSGALSFAADQARSHPDHRVITVLATDGLPTECLGAQVQTDAQAIAATAAIAKKSVAATPSIPTYVIGVFAPTDTGAQSNLQQLAAAGGTKQAFIVDQTQDVTKQLLGALAEIRSGSLACEYALPSSPQGQSLDFDSVNVQLTLSDHSTKNLLYVKSLDQCAKAALGWYYDIDPAGGGTPTKINICPDSCNNVRAQSGATLQIQLGCATLSPS